MLIGGLAIDIWREEDTDRLETHKDVDVLILSRSCRDHFEPLEEGIDWWMRHSMKERPTNGHLDDGLSWNVRLALAGLESTTEGGLFLPPFRLVHEACTHDPHFAKKDTSVRPWSDDPSWHRTFPVIPAQFLRWSWLADSAPVADSCF